MKPQIAIGNQTSVMAATAAEPFWYAVENHFDAFEWFPDKKPDGAGWQAADLDGALRRQILETARDQRIRLSVHAGWPANPPQPEHEAWLREDIQMAQDLGAKLINIHLDLSQGQSAFVRAILSVLEHLAETGIALSIENTPPTTPQDFNRFFAELRASSSATNGQVGMCLDLGHANLCPATRNDYLRYIDQLDPQVPIIHLHLHENYGDRDSHLPLFTGPAGRDPAGIRGLIGRLKARAYRGSLILEQWPQPPTLLNQARERFQELAQEAGLGATIESPPPTTPAPAEAEFRREAEIGEQSTPPNEALDGFAGALVEADRGARSWREKLEAVRDLLADDTRSLAAPDLIDLAIYLRFLATGEIACAEDGRHFRPSHHARMSAEIQDRLAKLQNAENAFILRRIHRWLPSSDEAFLRAEPLTRIRDIAHRNDIPHELKQEIKHSLQNKLHRCAGPEDLATATSLLERITQPGADFAAAFVEQFKIFHTELREFFNAGSLEEQLNVRMSQAGPEEAELVRRFLEAKQKPDPTLHSRLDCLESLTELRRLLSLQIKNHPGSDSQRALSADLGLDDYAFVLLSQLGNDLNAAKDNRPVEFMLRVLVLAATNLDFSQVRPEESRALATDLTAWRQNFVPTDREQLLRLKATGDRAKRLADDFADQLTALFLPRVELLGQALGVPQSAIRVFGDAEIRGAMIFQFAKLVSELLRYLREKTSSPPWDVLVPGAATGQLCCVDSLERLEAADDSPLIVLLKQAEGDEEIPGKVVGIVLAHAIPHLSHLGLRARQARVVFVAGDDTAKLGKLERFQGECVTLEASPNHFSLTPSSERKGAVGQSVDRPSIVVPKVKLDPPKPLLPLNRVTRENGGAKADAARRLQELSKQADSGFKTPLTFVVAFGVMEQWLGSQPELHEEYRKCLALLKEHPAGVPASLPASARELRAGRDAGAPGLEHGAVIDRLTGLIRQIVVPDEFVAQVAQAFGQKARLIVRSSSNCEDLEGFASAGLYESIAGVAPSDISEALKRVWASLWTKRAVAQRHEAGISHSDAYMAVILQELVPAQYSFIMHTTNSLTGKRSECVIELAVGLGETLASAACPGNPFRLIARKDTPQVHTEAFASFSSSLEASGAGGGPVRNTITYSKIEFASDASVRQKLGGRLAALAAFIEDAFHQPQDVEGAIVEDDMYLVQARTQP